MEGADSRVGALLAWVEVGVPKRPCNTCGVPAQDGYCPRHPRKRAIATRTAPQRYMGVRYAEIRKVTLIEADFTCRYCSLSAATADHVIPRSRRGGHTTRSNVVACCSRCNTSKGARTLKEWVESGCAPPGAREYMEYRIREGLPV